jgi:hypothetical protein
MKTVSLLATNSSYVAGRSGPTAELRNLGEVRKSA